MIEIIREEDAGGTTEKRGLPKDIKQMGKPDIGDRIYVENQIYRFLHPYSSLDEKKAYVLLGRFENYAGKQCVFVEAAIPLREIAFEGELPLWNDQTWAYIYKQLRHEYDSMVIVGWAMDIQGQLPNMTARLEKLHQNNFGGAHQVLFLMDSLEREDAFYGSRNGHLYRRDGFYIYYEKNRQHKSSVCAAEILREETEPEGVNPGRDTGEAGIHDEGLNQGAELSWNAELSPGAELRRELEEKWDIEESGSKKAQETKAESMEEPVFAEKEPRERLFSGREMLYRGNYRKETAGREEKTLIPSYASTLLLLTVVCALGVTAYLNNEKMAAMEATLAQMNQSQGIVTEVTVETERGTEAPEVAVESVAGNVQKQEEAQTEDDAAQVSRQTQGEEDTETMDAVGENTDGTLGTTDVAGETSDASGETSDASGETSDAALSTAETEQNEAAAQTSTTETSALTEAQMYLEQGYYIVQSGDSLVGICRKIYQTTAMLDKLCEVNGIEDADAIYAGQRLTLPN